MDAREGHAARSHGPKRCSRSDGTAGDGVRRLAAGRLDGAALLAISNAAGAHPRGPDGTRVGYVWPMPVGPDRGTIPVMTVEFASRALLTLFVVIDPLGLVPAFMALVGRQTPELQRAVARRAVLIAGAVLVVFTLVGGPFLAYLGVSVAALQIAGGILLFRIAMDMVFAQVRRETREEAAEARARDDVSVFPLAIPLIAGPGALASVLVLTAQPTFDPSFTAVVLGASVVVLFVAYLALRLASRVAALGGRTGVNVVTRVLGLVLAALAVQYVANGVTAVLR